MHLTREGSSEAKSINTRSKEWRKLHKEGLSLWKKGHDRLKEKAIKWLESQGYQVETEVVVSIRTTVDISVFSFMLRKPVKLAGETRYRVDVLGKKGEEVVIVECGDSPRGKLEELANFFKVYLLDWEEKFHRISRNPLLWLGNLKNIS